MDSLQSNIKQEEHNCIKTLVKPIESICATPTELADHCVNEEDYLPNELIINMEAWQDQEEAKGSCLIKQEHNRRLFQSPQTTEPAEDQVVYQTTLRAIERLTWCTYQRGNPRNGIFRHEIRSQDSKITQRVLTEPTRTTTRSCVRQLLDNG